MYVLFQIRPRLISGQDFTLGIRLSCLYHTSEGWFIRRRSFFFSSLCSLRGMTLEFWVSSVSQIMSSVFTEPKSKCFCVFNLRWINGNCLVSVIWKITMFCLFGSFFLSTNHDRRFASPLTHVWVTGSGVLPCPSHLVLNREGWKKDGPSIYTILLILAY